MRNGVVSFALLMGLAIVSGGCASLNSPPLLETYPGHVPDVADLNNHIACELRPLVASIRSDKKKENFYLATRIVDGRQTLDTDNWELASLFESHPELNDLLPKLVKYSFIAAVAMTLDVLDTEGVNPSLSYINPYNSMGSFNGLFNAGASVNGTQEHNQVYSYTINLLKLWESQNHMRCGDSSWFGGLEGDLGLVRDTVSGLLSLNASADLNIAGSASPIVSSASASLERAITLRFTGMTTEGSDETGAPQQDEPSKSGGLDLKLNGGFIVPPSGTGSQGTLTITGTATENGKSEPRRPVSLELTLSGGHDPSGGVGFTVSPPTTGSQGTLTLTGTATDNRGFGYFVSLTGSTYKSPNGGALPYSISGNLTRTRGPSTADINLGVNPKITLAGNIDISKPLLNIQIKSGSITPDSSTGTAAIPGLWIPTGTGLLNLEGKVSRDYVTPFSLSPMFAGAATTGAGGSSGSGGAKASASATGSAGSSTTQFSTFDNFQLSYGLNIGGPTWTLKTFKGPAGATSPLLTLNRSDTDTLTITFVPACKQGGQNNLTPTTFWQAIPVCDSSGTLQALAGASGQNFNFYRTH